eukprot:CAMPEP_0172546908 /NCGR_PEP_ID=MMETSP1067-20121228/16577_1 /TAXON_ID=265564 ORGANISM="Thalassiosira punctigera, Strain Tpunct2005C2" /NCGR_SAMPLE_ID=MMETSP1067 /ASSEMBLY_ACC=CAM_ASM_000444 /LENGTH=34 /DNA_ID= /DNA_START= /DNA_END= /DNA_ORIENTATION=
MAETNTSINKTPNKVAGDDGGAVGNGGRGGIPLS